MKRLLFSLVALALTSICFAQDVLVKKDGSTILAKILRITETEVEYKNFDNPDGPTRVISISSLLRINYQNGQSETFAAGTPDDIVTRETATKFSNDQQLLQMYNSMKPTPMEVKAKRLKIAGWVVGSACVITGTVISACCHIRDDYNYGYYTEQGLFLGIGIPTIAAGCGIWATCYFRAKNIKKKAMLSVESSPVFQQEFNVGKNERLMVGVDILNDNTMKHQTVGMGIRYNF
ncbi:MAG: hypothetical protein K2O17_03095 [Bacteroidaceae bacterium]|nr:hypothetical protein [Bacteroidaceae bacterium]